MIRLISLIAALIWSAAAHADQMRLAVTTSFHNSGLADILLPEIQADLGLQVQLLVVGTGQALRLGRAGDVDAILVHSRAAEEAFVAEGYGTHRREIMYNDFVLVGPAGDPAAVGPQSAIGNALRRIAETQAIFVSRGDDSGTHRRELSLWASAGIGIDTADPAWYRAAGAGMGATLNVASGMGGYVLTDRASWLNFANKDGLTILFQGDPALFNQYAYLPVDPAQHAHVKHRLAQKLEGWLVSPKAQAMIGAYEIGGQRLFTPNATDADAPAEG
ncbi:MAG: substrate-binding domain-containing protein [Rhodobacter sp.]|nr:substrate-binding domain-containing protein [Rhodobacter sp.]